MATHVARETSELRLLTRAIAILALLTGLVYGRAILGGSLAGDDPGAAAGETLLLLTALCLACAGLLAAWRWEGSGGLIAVAAGFMLGALVFRAAEHGPASMSLFYGSPFVIAGAMFVACWWRCLGVRPGND